MTWKESYYPGWNPFYQEVTRELPMQYLPEIVVDRTQPTIPWWIEWMMPYQVNVKMEPIEDEV